MHTFLGQLIGQGRSAWWLLLAICAARASSAFFGVVNIDETDFGLVARVLSHGGVIYRDVVDNKPPLVYVAYLPSALTHFSLWPVRILGVAVLFATCLVLRRVAMVWGLGDRAGWLCAWAGLLATFCEAPSVNAELLMNLPSSLALLALARARREGGLARLAAAGAWAGVASLVKQQAGMLLVALIVGAWWPEKENKPVVRHRGQRLVSATLLIGGFALPWALALLVWSTMGTGGDFVEWVIRSNLSHISTDLDPPWSRLWSSLVVCIVVATPLLWILASREAVRPWDPVRATLASAFVLAWIPVSLGGRFYEHYFLQFAPPLALLAGAGADRDFADWSSIARWKRAGMLALVILPIVGWVGYGFARGLLGAYPAQEPRTREIAAWLRAHAGPGDRLFVWGNYTPLYWLAQMEPGTRFLNTLNMGNFDPAFLPDGVDLRQFRNEVDIRRTLDDLEARRPAWVVDTAPADIHHWSRVPLSAFPEFRDYVEGHYIGVATVAGAVIYRRRDQP